MDNDDPARGTQKLTHLSAKEYVRCGHISQSDFDQVCARLGFDDSALPHINSSDKKSRKLRRSFKNFIYRNQENNLRSYTDFYDDETREFVADLYRSDIEMVGYSFLDALRSPAPK